MQQALIQIALRLFLCAAVVLPVWLWLGPSAFVLCAPLVGGALARPLIDLAASLRQMSRERAYADIEGRHYAFKGQSLNVIEDDAGQRWLATRDLRKIIDGFPSDALLARLHPAQVSMHGSPPAAYLLDETVLVVLERAVAPRTLGFKVWLERAIARPGRGVRERDARTLTRLPPADGASSTIPPSSPATAGA